MLSGRDVSFPRDLPTPRLIEKHFGRCQSADTDSGAVFYVFNAWNEEKVRAVPSVGRLCISARLDIEYARFDCPQRKPQYRDGQSRLMMWSNFCRTKRKSTCLHILIVARRIAEHHFHDLHSTAKQRPRVQQKRVFSSRSTGREIYLSANFAKPLLEQLIAFVRYM